MALDTTCSRNLHRPTSAVTSQPDAPRTSTTGRRSDPPDDQIAADVSADAVDFQTVGRVLDVLKEGEMDMVRSLDALSWENRYATADPTTRDARTNLLHGDRLATAVSRWLSPPRTMKGILRAGGSFASWRLLHEMAEHAQGPDEGMCICGFGLQRLMQTNF